MDRNFICTKTTGIMSVISFAEPWWLMLLLVVPFLAWWQYYHRTENDPFIFLPVNLPQAKPSLKVRLMKGLPALRLAALTFGIIAMARPVLPFAASQSTTRGIDIVISIDISGSMLARDFEPNRLEAAKQVARQFILSRPNDRIGLVIFAGESYTQCPVTSDHRVLLNMLEQVNSQMLEDGTAIGMGLATAAARMKDSDAKSKVVILMTDGINNAGYIDPATAMEMTEQMGIKVYTIGVGTTGTAPYPVRDAFGRERYEQMPVQIDEDLLVRIAETTGGEYYRATDNESLSAIYKAIDQLEKSRITLQGYNFRPAWQEPFVLLALLLVFFEIFLRLTLLRTAL
jgi:Ca-activated chloride channel homolog